MSRKYRLQKLLKHPHIWRPGNSSAVARSTIPSGFKPLDLKLGGGWPVGGLTEVLLHEEGIGELRLLMPALALLSNTGNPWDIASSSQNLRETAGEIAESRIAWIAPPYIPYAPALSLHGMDISQLLIIHADKQPDALWAMEQVLSSSVCVAALAWLTALNDRSMRRLQLAAEAGPCWAVVFRHARFAETASHAALRIRLQQADDQLRLDIIRNRYGTVGSVFVQC
jgi:cell division inhibitor SulA/protein ImuA